VAAAVLAVSTSAWANGRPPQAMTLHVRPGNPADLVMGATFGAMVSHDAGATWQWFCEYAVGYGGMYDPDYAITAPGTIFATTFDGIQINRDGCVFALSPFGVRNASQVAVDATGAVLVAMVYPGDETQIPPAPPDHKIYKSTTDGMTFDAGTAVGVGTETWISLETAPSDPQRIYLTGYRFESGMKTLVLFRSDNGGTSYTPLPTTDFTPVSAASDIQIAAISTTDPDRLLMRVTKWSGVIGDAFYLSTDAGAGWTKVLELTDEGHGVIFRANGDAVIGTSRSGVYRSTTGGASFTLISAPDPDAGPTIGPEITCMVEIAGEVWACTNNFQTAPFSYGVMKTTDLLSWTGVMTFQDGITGPVDCPVGTYQQDCCTVHVAACPAQNVSTWCFLQSQLGIHASPIDCIPAGEPTPPPPKGGGCCDASAPVGAAALPTLVIAFGLTRRRRRSRVA
jgi:hypothetical protein